jgi:hypothetical protein
MDDGGLKLGHVGDDAGIIHQKRVAIIKDWENRKILPKQCVTCSLYCPS